MVEKYMQHVTVEQRHFFCTLNYKNKNGDKYMVKFLPSSFIKAAKLGAIVLESLPKELGRRINAF
jgi:hypothetical protein